MVIRSIFNETKDEKINDVIFDVLIDLHKFDNDNNLVPLSYSASFERFIKNRYHLAESKFYTMCK